MIYCAAAQRGRTLSPRYHNTDTVETTVEDPTLGPLDSRGQRVDHKIYADDLEQVDFFRGTYSGEVIYYDPSMTMTALEQRGRQLQNTSSIWIGGSDLYSMLCDRSYAECVRIIVLETFLT